MKNNVINKFILFAASIAGISLAPDPAATACVTGIMMWLNRENAAPLIPGTDEYEREYNRARDRAEEILRAESSVAGSSVTISGSNIRPALSRLSQEYAPRLGAPEFFAIIAGAGIQVGLRIGSHLQHTAQRFHYEIHMASQEGLGTEELESRFLPILGEEIVIRVFDEVGQQIESQ